MAFDITSYILSKKELEAAMEEVPHLNESGKIPAENLPSYVDDIENGYLHDGILYEDAEFTKPIIGEDGKIYVDLLTNFTYRWSGEAYVRVNEVDLSDYYTKNEAQAKIDAEHKLSANLIEENINKKFVSEDEKTVWGNKYDKPNTGIPATDLADAVQTSLGKADSAVQDANYVHTDNNFDATYKGKVDDNAAARHSHGNKELLDTYTQTEADLADAVGKKHNHTNKSVLDGITSSDIENWNSKADEIEVFKQADVTALPVSNIDEKTVYKVNSGDPSYYFLMLIQYTDNTKTEISMTLGGNFLFNIEDYDKDSAYIKPAAGWPWGSYDHPYVIKKSDISYDDDSDVTIYMEMDDELYNFSETQNAYMRLYTHAPEHFYDNYESQSDIDNCNAWVASQGPAITIARYIYLNNNWINFDELIDQTALNTSLNNTKQEIAQQIANNYILLDIQTEPTDTPITGTLTAAQMAILNKQTKIIIRLTTFDLVRPVLSYSTENISQGNVTTYGFMGMTLNNQYWYLGIDVATGNWNLVAGDEYQEKLVSGTSIKTINNQSLLGSGDITTGTYSKPNGGIPKTDLDNSVQTSLGKADTALQSAPVTSVNGKTGAVTLTASDVGAGTYSKPSGGIPKTDLTGAVQTSLGKADSAVQDANYVHTDNNYTNADKQKLSGLPTDIAPTLLWTNPNPNAEFANQTIDVNMTNYKYIIIEYKRIMDANWQETAFKKLGVAVVPSDLPIGFCLFEVNSVGTIMFRQVACTSLTKLNFLSAHFGSDESASNDCLIPIRVYGTNIP